MNWPDPQRLRPYARPFAVAVLIALVLGVIGWARCGWRGCPDVERLRAYQPGGASKLFDRNGREFAELRPVEAETAPLKTIPKHVREAFLAVEDQRFYDHGGVDWRRVGGAAFANLREAGVAEGFSTITMQLARNVFPDRLRASQRTLWRKFAEVRVAFDIESNFSKDEILELYLSHIYFGNGARGIQAASKYYFGVPASQLSLAQAATLAALPKGPALYDPRRHPKEARERRDLVLTLMEDQRRISAAEAQRARATALRTSRRRELETARPEFAPWFVEEVRRQAEEQLGEQLYTEGLRVYTTLDLPMQQAAEQELVRQVRALDGRGAGLEGAFFAMDPRNGDVLAWVGGRDFTQSRFDRVRNARRQAGSAFKPFVYAAALGEGHTLNERIADQPITIKLASTRAWKPQNYDGRFSGAVTLRDALVFSKNVPTITLAADVGLNDVARVAREAGITEDMDLTPAMPLGTVAVSPMELVTAYTPFATLGTAVAPRVVLSAKTKDDEVIWEADESDTREVIDPEIAFLVTDVLQDAVDRGSGAAVRALGFSAPAAGKTGTTNDATDAWFVGYTPAVVGAVWIGHDQPQSLGANATGGRLAAPVWARIMTRTSAAQGGTWKKPSGIVERWIDAASGTVLREGCRSVTGAGYREVFLRGRVPAESCPQRGDMYAANRALTAPPVEETVLEEWPTEIAGHSEPAPPVDLEEAERASRVIFEAEEEEREEQLPPPPQLPQTPLPQAPPAAQTEEAAKKEEAAKAEQQKKAAESVILPQKPEPPKPPGRGEAEPGKVTRPPGNRTPGPPGFDG
jgi:penicillin-binding protein 1A